MQKSLTWLNILYILRSSINYNSSNGNGSRSVEKREYMCNKLILGLLLMPLLFLVQRFSSTIQ